MWAGPDAEHPAQPAAGRRRRRRVENLPDRGLEDPAGGPCRWAGTPTVGRRMAAAAAAGRQAVGQAEEQLAELLHHPWETARHGRLPSQSFRPNDAHRRRSER